MIKKNLLIFVVFVLAITFLAQPVFAEGTLEKIKSKGVMVAGVKDSLPPFGYVDEKTRQIIGYDIDIVKYIADKLKVKLELKPVTSASRIPMLAQGNIDIIAATMTHTKEREQQINFSLTYFLTGQKLLVKKGGGIKGVKDLEGKKVGTAKGSTSEQNIKKAQPKAIVISFDDYPQAFLALQQGKVVAVTTDESILIGLKNSAKNSGDFEIPKEFISTEPYGLGIQKGDKAFTDAVDKILLEMEKKGEAKKAYDKWFSKNGKFYIPDRHKFQAGK